MSFSFQCAWYSTLSLECTRGFAMNDMALTLLIGKNSFSVKPVSSLKSLSSFNEIFDIDSICL
ncbi:MAG: hypothetical protein AB1777_00125 [Bacteroidota bacterium]